MTSQPDHNGHVFGWVYGMTTHGGKYRHNVYRCRFCGAELSTVYDSETGARDYSQTEFEPCPAEPGGEA